ncbi:MAG: YcxB family protein [Burkholderiales bacterium]
MQIEIDLDQSDWTKYQTFVEKTLAAESGNVSSKRWMNILLWILTIVFLLALNFIERFDWPTAVYVSLVFISLFGALLFQLKDARKAFEPAVGGVFCGRHKLSFTEEGIVSSGRGYHGLHSWKLVKKIVRAEGMILIFLDTIFAYVLPESKLPNPDELYEYVTRQHRVALARSPH